jgi:hypothetical protein
LYKIVFDNDDTKNAKKIQMLKKKQFKKSFIQKFNKKETKKDNSKNSLFKNLIKKETKKDNTKIVYSKIQ